MVAKRFKLLHLSIPECSHFSMVKNPQILESGALDRSAKQPTAVVCSDLNAGLTLELFDLNVFERSINFFSMDENGSFITIEIYLHKFLNHSKFLFNFVYCTFYCFLCNILYILI